MYMCGSRAVSFFAIHRDEGGVHIESRRHDNTHPIGQGATKRRRLKQTVRFVFGTRFDRHALFMPSAGVECSGTIVEVVAS